jgi:hypothetical protein
VHEDIDLASHDMDVETQQMLREQQQTTERSRLTFS